MDTKILMTMTDSEEEVNAKSIKIMFEGQYGPILNLLAEGLVHMCLEFDIPIEEAVGMILEEIHESLDE